MFRHTRAIVRESVGIKTSKTFLIQRQKREWQYKTTHILNVVTPLGVAQSHVVAALTYAKGSVCPRLCGLYTGCCR
jgi:hypothetical protein